MVGGWVGGDQSGPPNARHIWRNLTYDPIVDVTETFGQLRKIHHMNTVYNLLNYLMSKWRPESGPVCLL